MAIDQATYVGAFNVELPANRDPLAEGAAQIRAIKRAIQQTFPNLNSPVTASADDMNSTFTAPGIPIGAIAMYMGDAAPDGWAFCDGELHNNVQTPDMRGKIPMGISENSSDINVTGATNLNPYEIINLSEFLDSKPHVLTITEMPSHTHDLRIDNPDSKDNQGGGSSSCADHDNIIATTTETGGGAAHSHELADIKTLDVRGPVIGVNYIMYVGSTSGDGNTIPTVSISPQTGSLPADGSVIELEAYVTGTPAPTLVWRLQVDNDPVITLSETTASLDYIPVTSGTHQFTCIAINDEGSNSASSVWTIGTAPSISNPTYPQDGNPTIGDNLTMFAYADGSTSWKWQFTKDNTDLDTTPWTDINNAVGTGGKAQYSIVSYNALENEGYYRCVFSNDYGSTNSREATVGTPGEE